jgi:hypothetical protein
MRSATKPNQTVRFAGWASLRSTCALRANLPGARTAWRALSLRGSQSSLFGALDFCAVDVVMLIGGD